MKQVDFYLIGNQVSNAKHKMASRLANKLQRSEMRALVVTENKADAATLNDVMWTFNDASFLAHDDLVEKNAVSRVQYGAHTAVSQEVLARGYDVLINLANDVPVYSHHFSRIAEIIENDDASKAAARARYKIYKTEGFELKMHNIEL